MSVLVTIVVIGIQLLAEQALVMNNPRAITLLELQRSDLKII